MRTLNKSTLILFIGILAVSTASLFIRKAQTTLPSSFIAAGRLVLASLIMIPFNGKGVIGNISSISKNERVLVGLAGVFLGFHFITWIKSLEFTTIASSVILVTTTPVWVAMFSPIFLKEKITRQVVIGLLVAMLGIIVLFLFPSVSKIATRFTTKELIGNGLALIGAWMMAAYTIVGRHVRDSLPFRNYILLVYGIAALIACLFAIPDLRTTPVEFGEGLKWVILLALIPQLIGHTLFNAAVRQIPAVYASIALLGEPVGTILLAWIFIGEKPGIHDLLGGAFVIVGILLAFSKEKKNQSLE